MIVWRFGSSHRENLRGSLTMILSLAVAFVLPLIKLYVADGMSIMSLIGWSASMWAKEILVAYRLTGIGMVYCGWVYDMGRR
ncbi:hypothetical protein IW262DRAFT_545095 [Armillaria fumosa]|nr:hypothetical protein IW262DRAFT_545095 [Armillaria fumosa]